MSPIYQCGNHEGLVGYMYDECDPGERAAIDAHLVICAACAAELAALQSTRIQLASWSPPEADLGFAISRPQASGPRPQRAEAWFGRPLPVWAQAAAAIVIFAAGLSLGIARGTMRDVPSSVVATAPAGPAGAENVTASSLDALERRLRGEIAQLRPAAATAAAAAPPSTVARGGPSDVEGQLLARVRALIDESEQRQQRELALRTAQLVRDFDSQRRVDLEQIQRNFGQIEGLAGAEVREQRQMLNYLMRVSQQQ
jgi:anti-sigma factor RsiW